MKYQTRVTLAKISASAMAFTFLGAVGCFLYYDSVNKEQHKLQAQKEQEMAISNSFNKFDLDKNGSIDYFEYESMINKLPFAYNKINALEDIIKKK